MTAIKIRDRCGIAECPLMKLREHIRDLIVLTVDLVNAVHWLAHKCAQTYLPSIALMPSHTAPTNPVAITVITALNV